MNDTLASHRIANATSGSLLIYLEPWGDECTLAPGEHAELLIQFPAEHPVEWEFRDGTGGDLLIGGIKCAAHYSERRGG